MYVKIVTGRGAPGGESSQLFAVGKQVHYGTRYLEYPLDEVCWPDELGIEANALCHHRIDDQEPDGRTAGATPNDEMVPWWQVRWAWWWAPSDEPGHHSIECVVTRGDLYVMNDEGATVERVR